MLLTCLRGELPPTDASTARQLLPLAIEQGVLPMVAARMLRGPLGADAEAVAEWRGFSTANACRNLSLSAETLRVLGALEAAGHAPLIFKGCVLGQLAYGSCAARQAGDIDVFVSKDKVRAAIAVLGDCGYQLDHAWSEAVSNGHFLFDCECELRNAERGTSIDLHWDFTARNVSLPMPVARLLARAVQVPFCGQTVRTFNPEDQVLVLALHGAKHHWQRLEWVLALAGFIRANPRLDWEKIMMEAADMGLTALLGSGLVLTRDLFALPVPGAAAEWLRRDAVARELADCSLRWLVAGPEAPPRPFEVRCFHAASRASPAGKARFWLGAMMTPSEKDYRIPLPRWLMPLYYPIRTLRLAGEAVVTAVANARRCRPLASRTLSPRRSASPILL